MKKKKLTMRLTAILLAAGMVVADAPAAFAMTGAAVPEQQIQAELAEDSAAAEDAADPYAPSEDAIDAVGSEVAVSKVIGLEGKADANVMSSDDDTVKMDYVDVSPMETGSGSLPGKCENYLDPATGLYLYNGVYYSYGDSYTDNCYLNGKVASISPAPFAADPATGFCSVDGKLYSGYYITENHYYYVQVSSEIEVLGQAAPDTDLDAAYGRKLSAADRYVSYYEVNGRFFDDVYSSSGFLCARKCDEISFAKKRHCISWTSVSNNTQVDVGGKLIHIGYQVKVNGTAAELEKRAADGSTFTSSTSYTGNQSFAAGEKAVYEVRAVYYTEANGVNTIVKTGAWSDAYAYAYSAAVKTQQVPVIADLSVKQKSARHFELSWSAVSAASGYEVEYYAADAPVADPAAVSGWGSMSDESTDTYRDIWLDSDDKKYIYYRVKVKVDNSKQLYVSSEGAPSNIVLVAWADTPVIPAVTGFAAETKKDGSFILKWNPVDEAARIRIYYSKDPSALSNAAYQYQLADPRAKIADADGDIVTRYLSDTAAVKEMIEVFEKKANYITVDGDTTEVDSSDFDLQTGQKYYFMAVTYDHSKSGEDRTAATPYVADGVAYGYFSDVSAPSAVTAVTRTLGKIAKPDTKSDKTSITISFREGSAVTGYEIYRKDSKGKYKKIATVSSKQYIDQDLKEASRYDYKARAYYYNTVTKKKINSDYVFFSAETSQNNYLDLTAVKKSSNSVKLSWTKVKNAVTYEIYRTSVSSRDNNETKKITDGNYYNQSANAKWQLIKTIKKAKTVSYTDKKLVKGTTYSYKIVATYKEGSGKKAVSRQLTDSDSVTLDLTAPLNVKTTLSGSKVKISWDKDPYAKKYQVRYTKYNAQGKAYTDRPVTKSVSKSKNSYSISLGKGEYVTAAVRANDGKKWTDWAEVRDSMKLAAAKSISAKNVTVKDANGKTSKAVKVSWKKVSGAAYYRVYCSTSPSPVYNKDLKYYNMPGDERAVAKESNDDESIKMAVYEEYKGQYNTVTGTSVIDRGDLQKGVVYYYYVIAYAENGTAVSAGSTKPASVCFDVTASIKKVSSKKGKAVITINKVSGAKSYVVYRSTKKSGGYEKVGTTKKTTYTDKSSKKGKTYYYKVAAAGTNGLKAQFESPMSSAKKIKVK